MKNSTFYHGTSLEVLESILKEGIQPIPCSERLWNGSYPNQVYLWKQIDDGDAFSNAFESGTTACLKSLYKHVVVLEVSLPESSVSEDYSGVNMSDVGAVCIDVVPRRNIRNVYISDDISIYMMNVAICYINNDSSKWYGSKWLERDLKHCTYQESLNTLDIGADLKIPFSCSLQFTQIIQQVKEYYGSKIKNQQAGEPVCVH